MHLFKRGFMRNFYLTLSLLVLGCTPVPEKMSDDIVVVPEIADEAASVIRNTSLESTKNTVQIPGDENFDLWWRYTGNKDLELLIDRALVNSQPLQIAAQRIIQAKAQVAQAKAEGLPSLRFQASVDEGAPVGGIGSVPRGELPSSQRAYEVGLAGSYTFDLWGQRHSLTQSAELKLKRAIFQYDAQRLDLISQLAKSYFSYLSLNDRIANARATEEALSAMLQAMQQRYDQGDATVVEMQIQRSAIFSSRVRLPTLLKDKQQLEFEIARLVGVAPGNIDLTHKGLSSVNIPETVQGISTAYVLRRPDIRAIESGMLAADADLDVARKAMLPGLSMSADISSAARTPADLFQPNTLIWNMLATISANIFDGGAAEQNVKFAQAVRNELVESYANTVYNGLTAARTALTELEFSSSRLSMQQTSADAARVAQEFGFESYSVGGIDFITYLDSMQSYQERMDALHQFELQYFQAYVDLFAALGGGIPYRSVLKSSPVFEADELPNLKILPKATVTSQRYRVDGWLEQPEYFSQSPWMVKLTGVYDRFATEALLRDLPRRYETLKPAKDIFIENVDVGIDTDNPLEDTNWYSVNFVGFESEVEAQGWCERLREQQQRCVVYQPNENFEIVAKFNIDLMQKRASLANDSYLARQKAKRSAIENTAKSSDELEYGSLYSLLKIEDGHAWLIGNRSHRVWRFPVGASLAYKGSVKSIMPHRVVLTQKGQDFVLRPIYRVDAITHGSKGERFARMRWGGKSGEVFFHRVGDRIYGRGLIRSISDKGVVVDWKGKRVTLPLGE